MLTEKEISDLNLKKEDVNSKISLAENEKQALYEQNASKVDLRTKTSSKSSSLLRLAWISFAIGIIGLLFFNGFAMIAMPIVGIGVFIWLQILRVSLNKTVKALSEELTDYDSAVAEIDQKISKLRSFIESIDYELNRDATERRYAKVVTNHICVYVGKSTSPSLTNGKPQETAEFYETVYDVTVYIDGVEYGNTSEPFAAFEVTPGPHVVKIVGYYKFGGVDRYVESTAKQVNVSSRSVFLFYHWNFYGTDKGVSDTLFLNVYNNPYDLLEATHKN